MNFHLTCRPFHFLMIVCVSLGSLSLASPNDCRHCVDVDFVLKVDIEGEFTITLNDVTASKVGESTYQYYFTPKETTKLIAEKPYTLEIELGPDAGGEQTGDCHHVLINHAGCGLILEYLDEDDGVWKKAEPGSFDEFEPDRPAPYTRNYEIRLRAENDGNDDPDSENNQPGTGEKKPEIVVEESWNADLTLPPEIPQVSRSIPLGGGAPGTNFSAGRLRFKQALNTGLPSREFLDVFSVDGSGTEVDRDSNGSITDIATARGLIKLSDLPNGINMKFFDLEDVDDLQLRTIKAGAVARENENITATGNGGFQFTISNTSGIRTAKVEFGGSNPTGYSWSNTDVDGDVTQFNSLYDSTTKTRVATKTQADQSVIRAVYKLFAWGEELVEYGETPHGENERVTIYSYYENRDEGAGGQIKQRIDSDGDWRLYTYHSSQGTRGADHGQLQSMSQPWLDLPAHPDDAQIDNCRRTEYEYQEGLSGSFATNLASVTEKILDVTVESTVHSDYWLGSAANNHRIYGQTITQMGNGEDLVSTVLQYGNDVPEPFTGKIYQREAPDGTLTTYDYEFGTYDAINHTFVPGVGVSSERITTFQTSTAASDGVPFVSTKHSSVVVNDNQVLTETYLFTGANTYVMLTQSVYVYDGNHRTETIRDGRIVHEQTWVDGQRQSQIDAQGIETSYTYWPDDNVKTATRSAGGGFPASVTTNTYDDGTLVSQSLASGGLTQTQSWTEDTRTDINLHIHQLGSSSDDPANRTRSQTDGNGNTTITTTFRDGQTKSVVGPHIVDRHYSYSVQAGGVRVTETRIGASEAPRFSRTYRDKLGQVVKEERPTFGGTGTLTLNRNYENGNLTSSDTPFGAQSVQGKISEGYYRSGLDKDGNGTLDLASNDQVSDQKTYYEQIGGDWYQVSEVIGYPTDGDLAPISLSRNLSQVSGLNGNVVSHILRQDHLGNQTVIIVEVDRGAKSRTERFIRPGVDGEEIRVHLNGYLKTIARPGISGQIVYTYDPLGRVTNIDDPATGLQTITYFGSGNLVHTESNGIDPPTTYAYFGNGSPHIGRVESITDAKGGTIFFGYDDHGNEDHRWGTATYEFKRKYNLYGQPTELQTFREPGQPDTTTWHYDPATGLLHQKEFADQKMITYGYASHGQVQTRQWARNITTTYLYDLGGGLETVTYSDETPPITYTRDRNGRPRTVSDAAGSHTLNYRPDGQLLSSVSAGGLLDGWTIVYQPDGVGRTKGYQVKKNDQAIATATQDYDSVGRLGTVGTGDYQVKYRYHPDSGLRTGIDHFDKHRIALRNDRQFDAAGRIKLMESRRRDNEIILRRDYTLDELGRRKRVDDETGGYWIYSYNTRSEVTGGTKHFADQTPIPGATFGYDFDGIGNRKTHTIGDLAPVVYTPNALNQYEQVISNQQAYLIGKTAEGATVTINSQPATETNGLFSGLVDLNNGSGPSVTQVSVTADKAGKQTQTEGALRKPPSSATYQYDDDGNLRNDGLWDYTWNGENRLIAAETVDTIPAAYRVKKEFVYDYRGRRVEERKLQFDETANDFVLEQRLRWIYDSWNPVLEIADDQPSRQYLWGLDLSETPQGAGGVGGLLMSLDLTNASLSYYPVCDANGNVIGLANQANGELIGQYEYTPFGKLQWKEGLAAEINRWRFSTKLQDGETGWLYYGFRYYMPTTGRWASRDPIGERGGVNLYGFLGNDGINFVDAYGLITYKDFLKELETINEPKELFDRFVELEGIGVNKNPNNNYLLTCYGGIIDLRHFGMGLRAVQSGAKTPGAYLLDRFDVEWQMIPRPSSEGGRANKIKTWRNGHRKGGQASSEDHPSEALGALAGTKKKWKQEVIKILKAVGADRISKETHDKFIEKYGSLYNFVQKKNPSNPFALPISVDKELNEISACCPKRKDGQTGLDYFQKNSGLIWKYIRLKKPGSPLDGEYSGPGEIQWPSTNPQP